MLNNVSFSKNLPIYEMMRKMLYSRTGHRWQYGACPFMLNISV